MYFLRVLIGSLHCLRQCDWPEWKPLAHYRKHKKGDNNMHQRTDSRSVTILSLMLITSAFAINEIQILFTFTLVRAASVDAHVKLICTVVKVFVDAFIDIWRENKTPLSKRRLHYIIVRVVAFFFFVELNFPREIFLESCVNIRNSAIWLSSQGSLSCYSHQSLAERV